MHFSKRMTILTPIFALTFQNSSQGQPSEKMPNTPSTCSVQKYSEAEQAAFKRLREAEEASELERSRAISRLERRYKGEISDIDRYMQDKLGECNGEASCTSGRIAQGQKDAEMSTAQRDTYLDEMRKDDEKRKASARAAYDAERKEAKRHYACKGWSASGRTGEVTYEGIICDVEVPFDVIGHSSGPDALFKFVPSGPNSGEMTLQYLAPQVPASSNWSASYVIDGIESDKPLLRYSAQGIVNALGHSMAHRIESSIQLSRLETDVDCK